MRSKNLIIGGNGYIGSALYQAIEADSVDLCMFGKDLGYSHKINYNNFDISSYKNIILLAGHSSVAMCENNKQNAWINNVDYFYNLCDKLNKDQLLIYASSASVYGKSSNVCLENNLNISPINQYDLTKITIDIIANKFINDGKKIIGLRFGTVNGYSPNIREDLMINSMILSAKKNGHIEVFDKWISRPILAIEDLVNSIICILESKNLCLGQYNLCSFNNTVDEISRNVSRILGCKIIDKEVKNDKNYDFSIDNKKFQDDYEFTFKCDIECIVKSIIDNKVSNFSGRKYDRLFNSFV